MSQPQQPHTEPPRRRHRARRLLWIFGLGLLAYVAMISGCQRAILFPTRVLPDVSGDGPPPGVERLTRQIDDGDPTKVVEAWLMPGVGEGPRPIVIFAHGNGEVIDLWPIEMQHYVDRGLSVLMVEYRGYGRSAGRPSQRDIVDDFVYFHDQVLARNDIDAARVIIHGRSIGGGVGTQLAAQREPVGLILESTFTSVADVASGFFVPRFLVRDPFDVERVLRTATYPVLIAHGTADTVVPVQHAERNHATAQNSRLLLFDGAGHCAIFPTESCWSAIDQLLADAGVPSTPPDASVTMPAPE